MDCLVQSYFPSPQCCGDLLVLCVGGLFLCVVGWSSIVSPNHSLCTSPPDDGRWGCFHFGAIMKKTV